MRPDSDPRQSRRTHNYYEFTFFIFRITARASGEAELNPELTARSASKHFPDQLQHYHTSLNEYISQAREHAQALRASYTNEVYELWHQHISTSAATDEASIASGSLTAQQLEELTRKWVRLMRESRDMLHHESTIAAARAAVEAKPISE